MEKKKFTFKWFVLSLEANLYETSTLKKIVSY